VSDADRPTFRAVREVFADHGISWGKKPLFKNDDLLIGHFRRGSTYAAADYLDDELIEPDTVEGWCRTFALKLDELHIQCGDGHVSVKPPIVEPHPDFIDDEPRKSPVRPITSAAGGRRSGRKR